MTPTIVQRVKMGLGDTLRYNSKQGSYVPLFDHHFGTFMTLNRPCLSLSSACLLLVDFLLEQIHICLLLSVKRVFFLI